MKIKKLEWKKDKDDDGVMYTGSINNHIFTWFYMPFTTESWMQFVWKDNETTYLSGIPTQLKKHAQQKVNEFINSLMEF